MSPSKKLSKSTETAALLTHPSPMLTPEAAGIYIGGNQSPIGVLTLADWRCKGKGPAFIKVGRLVRYRVADLDAWLTSRVELGA